MNDAQIEEAAAEFETAYKALAVKKGFDRFMEKVKPLILSAGPNNITDIELMELMKAAVGKVTREEVAVYAKKLAEYREKWGIARKTKARKNKGEEVFIDSLNGGSTKELD